MAATFDLPFSTKDAQFDTYRVPVATTVYLGQFLGRNSATGLARPLQAGDQFLGVVEDLDPFYPTDNDKGVKAQTYGLVEIPFTSAALADIGKSVYVSDDNTVTYTTGSNSYIGHVRNVVVGKSIIVRLSCVRTQLTKLTAATGTASDTVNDVTGTYSQSILNNNFKSIADKINEILKLLRGN